jgi:hypothetical protein
VVPIWLRRLEDASRECTRVEIYSSSARQTEKTSRLKKKRFASPFIFAFIFPLEKETIPGAINVPLDQLEGYLKKISKETYIVFT